MGVVHIVYDAHAPIVQTTLDPSLRTSLWATIASVTPDAIVAVDEDQRIVAFNDGAAAIFGWAGEEALGQPLDLLIPETLRGAHVEHVRGFAGAWPARHMGARRGVMGRRRNGEIFPAEVSISRIEVAGKTLHTALLRDVTDRWRREEAQRLVADVGTAATVARDERELCEVVTRRVADELGVICVVDLAAPVGGGQRRTWACPTRERRERPAGAPADACATLIADLLDYARDDEAGHPVAMVLRAGRPRLLPDIPELRLREMAGGEDALARLLAAPPVSMAAVPLEAHGRRLGVLILLAPAGSPVRFDDEHVELAEELGHLVAIAVEGARLLEATSVAEAGYRLLFDRNPHPMFVFDPATRAVFAVNAAAVARYGYTREEFLALTVDRLCPDAVRGTVGAFCGGLDAENGAVERRHRARDGSVFDVEVASHPLTFAGRPARLVLATDITARKRAEAALHALSLTDELTGLHNRRGFFTFAEQRLKLAGREGATVFVVYADLDEFKQINDTFGHLEGDHALVCAAGILRRTVRESDIVARLGGDEFTILATGREGEGDGDGAALVSRLREQVAAFNADSGRPWRLSMSVGTAVLDAGEVRSLDDLLARADGALYEQKRWRRLTQGAELPSPGVARQRERPAAL